LEGTDVEVHVGRVEVDGQLEQLPFVYERLNEARMHVAEVVLKFGLIPLHVRVQGFRESIGEELGPFCRDNHNIGRRSSGYHRQNFGEEVRPVSSLDTLNTHWYVRVLLVERSDQALPGSRVLTRSQHCDAQSVVAPNPGYLLQPTAVH